MKNAHGHRAYLNETARKLLKGVPRGDRSVWVFPKSVMGDYKHVGRRLAQRTRANIVAAPKADGAAAIAPTFAAMICAVPRRVSWPVAACRVS